MSVLVDEARWPWRGTRWCHLVSDDNLAELHDFAATLGMRRVGFQGDHYDIDVEMREIAIANGARPCDSREMIRRMRDAGLRLRPSSPFVKWRLDQRSDQSDADVSLVEADPELAPFLGWVDGWFVLNRDRSIGGTASGVVVFGSTGTNRPDLPDDDASVGLFSRIDHKGNWSVERISPPPTDNE